MLEDRWGQLAVSALIALPVTAGLATGYLEYLQSKQNRQSGLTSEGRLSLGTIPPNIVAYLVLAPWWATIYRQAREFGAALAFADLPLGILTIVGALIACDLSYYIEHRLAHRWPLLWRAYHATHHTGTRYHIPLAYRVSFVSQFFAPAFYVPWIVLGFDPLLIIGFQLFVFHYQAWLHTELVGTLGTLDRWLNTPANHRMHHDASLTRGVNFGAVTMVWDRLFGTYCRPIEVRNYGIRSQPAPHTVWDVHFAHWRPIRSAQNQSLKRDRLPPGRKA